MYWLYRNPVSDDVRFVRTRSTSNGWVGMSGTLDTSHEPALDYFAYIMTGDWFALQELYALAAYNPMTIPQAYGTNNIGRGRLNWAYNNDLSMQQRGQAWALRTLLQAAVAAPDGSPEKAHFTEKVNFNITIDEGRHGITNGTFPPSNSSCPGYDASTTTDPWCWGNKTVSQAGPNDGVQRISPVGILAFGHAGGCIGGSDIDQGITGLSSLICEQLWQNSFLYTTYGIGKDLGFGFDPILQFGAKLYLHIYLDPTYNPYLSEQKMLVATDASKVPIQRLGTPSDSSSEIHYVTNPSRTNWLNPIAGPSDYVNIAKAASSCASVYNLDGYTGTNAWAWAVANVPNSGANGNPKWNIVPRTVSSSPPSDTTPPFAPTGVTVR